MKRLMVIGIMLLFSVTCYAQEPEVHTLFIGEFENRADVDNPLLSYLNDTLDFLFSRSKLAKINPISAGLRSAYMQWARNEQPDSDATQVTLLAAEHAGANAVLMGSYTKTGEQWTMEAQLYMISGGRRAREDIQLAGDSVYSLLDNLAGEVSKRLGAGQYTLLSTKSWEAYEYYRQGHSSYYNFDLMGAMNQFQKAIELDPRLAIAQAELGISYAMMSMFNDAQSMFENAMKNRQYASEHEQLVVMGLEGFYRYYWVLRRGGRSTADMPRMLEDTVWDEPWLSLYIGKTSEDKMVRDRAHKRWLVSAIAYAEAGFYGVAELVSAGTDRCLDGFNATKDEQFLNAALQFISQAANLEEGDEYDDVWEHWEIANIYGRMGKRADAKKQREVWLKAVKGKPINSLSPGALNDFAGKCLEMGASKDAVEFAAKAVELESDIELRSLYLVSLADAYLASGKPAEAFNSYYVEAFEVLTRGNVSTSVLLRSLSGLARLLRSHPGFVDGDRQAKLNEIVNAIGDMDPLIFRAYNAHSALYSSAPLVGIWHFCHTMGDMEPLLEIVRSLLREESAPVRQLVYLAYLIALNSGVSESERNWLSSPEFIQAIADLNSPIVLGWVYEMIGEQRKAAEAYEDALKSELPAARMIAFCALVSLRHSLGEEIASQPHVYLEAEEAQSFTPYFEAAEAPEASGGRYLWAPDTSDGSHDGKGQAEYEFEIPQSGTYRLVARMLAVSLYADGVQVSIGNNETDMGVESGGVYRNRASAKDMPIAIELSEPDLAVIQRAACAAWEWVPAGKSFTLSAGKHGLIVHNKEDGVKLDCMVLYYEGKSR